MRSSSHPSIAESRGIITLSHCGALTHFTLKSQADKHIPMPPTHSQDTVTSRKMHARHNGSKEYGGSILSATICLNQLETIKNVTSLT